jgi:predicted PurR-regulated permease PerM
MTRSELVDSKLDYHAMAKRSTRKSPVRKTVKAHNPVSAPSKAIVQPRTVPETVILITAILLLVVLGYSIQPILSPFLLVGSLLYLLYPMREIALVRRIMWLSVILFAFWFFYSILGLLVPFIVAFLIAYILNPLVTVLQQRGFPRWASSLIVVVLFLAIVVSVFLFVVPPAIQQFNGILSGISVIVRDFADLLKSGAIFEWLAGYGVPVETAREIISEQISPKLENLLTILFEGVFGFLTGISTIVMQFINAVIIPFLVFYVLMDFPVITQRFSTFVPKHRRDRVIELARKVDTLIGRYLRGAITVAIIQGTISATALWIIGVKFALVLGIMTGILNFIPYVGLITSLVVSSIVAIFSGGPVVIKVVAVVAVYLSQKLLEATVLAPKIIGSQVGLHPVLLILCLLVFGYFLGFVGLLIAVPATALIIAAVQEWELRRKEGQAPQPHQAM